MSTAEQGQILAMHAEMSLLSQERDESKREMEMLDEISPSGLLLLPATAALLNAKTDRLLRNATTLNIAGCENRRMAFLIPVKPSGIELFRWGLRNIASKFAEPFVRTLTLGLVPLVFFCCLQLVAHAGQGRAAVRRRCEPREARSLLARQQIQHTRVGVVAQLASKVSEDGDDRSVGKTTAAGRDAPARRDQRTLVARPLRERSDQPALADAGVAADQDGRGPPIAGRVESGVERRQLLGPAHELGAGHALTHQGIFARQPPAISPHFGRHGRDHGACGNNSMSMSLSGVRHQHGCPKWQPK
jgi:hypothetical protein